MTACAQQLKAVEGTALICDKTGTRYRVNREQSRHLAAWTRGGSSDAAAP